MANLSDKILTSSINSAVTLANSAVQLNDSPTFAGLTVDTDTLFVDATNNRLGIGKTNPATALDVTGTVTATSYAGDGSAITNLTSGNLVGALPAIDGSALTGVGGLYQSIATTNITTAVASVEFDLDTTTYKEFRLRVRGLVNSTNAQNSLVQFSPDDGVTWRTAGYYGHSIIGGTVSSVTTGFVIGAGTLNVAADGGSSADMTITVGDGSTKTQGFMVGHGVYYQTSSFFQGSGARYNTAEAHDKMRIIPQNGTLASGTIELMGELA